MAIERVLSLAGVRTDGWFERVAEGVGSFDALCDILGESFFAFAMIVGARITALTVDRRVPDNTVVEFAATVRVGLSTREETRRVRLGDFRRQLVDALLTDEDYAPAPPRADAEALQHHVGVRFLLLAPLFGYELEELTIFEDGPNPPRSVVTLSSDGVSERVELPELRERLRAHVRDELRRASAGARGSVDVSVLAEAEAAAAAGQHQRVVALLGAWPSSLVIYLRTAEGQALTAEGREQLARGLALLGASLGHQGERARGEEVLRLAVQYAGDGPASAEVFLQLGLSMLADGRAGEAIGALRRGLVAGARPNAVWPALAKAFHARGKHVAALGCLREAEQAGADEEVVRPLREALEAQLGPALGRWAAAVQ